MNGGCRALAIRVAVWRSRLKARLHRFLRECCVIVIRAVDAELLHPEIVWKFAFGVRGCREAGVATSTA